MYNISFALNSIMSNGGTEYVVLNIFNYIDKTLFYWANYILTFSNGYIRRDTRNELINAVYSAAANMLTLANFCKKYII